MEFPIFIAGCVIFFGLAIFAHIFDAKRHNAAWTLAAKRLGLAFPGDVINGSLDGVRLTVRVITRGVGKSQQNFTVVVLNMPGDLPFGMSIQPENLLDKVNKLIGAEDVQLGLPELDPKLLVTAPNENKIRVWAQRPDVVTGLRRLVRLKSYSFHLTPRHFSFERRGTMANADKLEALIRELVGISQDFSRGTLTPQISSESSIGTEEDDENIW